jgi:hypothetical protein
LLRLDLGQFHSRAFLDMPQFILSVHVPMVLVLEPNQLLLQLFLFG